MVATFQSSGVFSPLAVHPAQWCCLSAGQSAQVAWVSLCAQTHTWSLRTALRGWTQSQVDLESGGPCSTACRSTMGDRRMVFGDGLEDIKVKLGEGESV